MPQFNNISPVSYGADPNGNQDSTAAFNAAIAAAKEYDVFSLSNVLSTAIRIIVPKGIYLVSSINFTNLVGVDFISSAWQSGCIIYGNQQTEPRPILDCTGSSSCSIRGITFAGENTDGSAPNVIPECAVLVANRADVFPTNTRMSISGCGTLGRFSKAAFAFLGASEYVVNSSSVLQNKTAGHTLYISDSNDLNFHSDYESIHPGSIPGKNGFIGDGVEIHGGSEVL